MMADTENKYYQVAMDGVDAQPVTSRPGKVALLLCGWTALLSIVVLCRSEPTSPMTSAAESTDLMSLSRVLRPSGGAGLRGAGKPSIINALPGSSPFKKIAVSAIQANDLYNRGRDVSMMAGSLETQESLDGLLGTDDETKEAVAKMEKAVAFKAQDMAGVTGPLGFFDPLGFTTDCEQGKLLFYREVELKHGRVAMLATLGLLVGEQFHPLFGGNIDVPSYVAFQQTPLQTFWGAVVAAIAIPEIFSVFSFQEPKNLLQWANTWQMKTDRQPGDLGFDPLGLKPQDAKEFKEMQTKELNNGRLAMIAAAGMIAQEVATGQKMF